MRKGYGLKIGMVCAVAFSGVAAMPAPSWATTTLSTTVASTSSTGPNTANTEVLSVANCSGKLVSGGGARVTVTSGTMPDGLKLDGTFPSTNGTGQSANGDTSPTYWIVEPRRPTPRRGATAPGSLGALLRRGPLRSERATLTA